MKNDLGNFDDSVKDGFQGDSSEYDGLSQSQGEYDNVAYSKGNFDDGFDRLQDDFQGSQAGFEECANESQDEIDKKPEVVEKRKWTKNWVIVALLGFIVILIIVILILLLRGPVVIYRDRVVKDDSAHADIMWETSAEEGGLETRDPAEIQEELNRKVEEGMINIQMNTTVSFPDGESEGNLGIVNSEVNNWPQVVQIVRKDTEEEIFKSGAIPVGHKLETGKLDVKLPAGEYECVAYFSNVDVERGLYMGTAGAEIIVKVLG